MSIINSFTLILLAAFPLINQSANYGCYKPLDAIPGCTCTQGWNAKNFVHKTAVTCSSFNRTSDEFKDYLWKLNGRAIDDLIITNYPSNRLPGDVFTSAVIKRIVISNSPKLQGFGPKGKPENNFFTNLGNSLETLVVSNCPNIAENEWLSIGESLTKTSALFGTGSPVLKSLNIVSNNKFIISDVKVWEKLSNIEVLILRANDISVFEEDLQIFTKLDIIDLSSNKNLKKFNPKGLPPSLKTVLLGGTGVNKFSLQTLEMLKDVELVDLNKNKLSCYCDDIQEICDREDLQRKFPGAICREPVSYNNTIYGSSCFGPLATTQTTTQTTTSPILSSILVTSDTPMQSTSQPTDSQSKPTSSPCTPEPSPQY